MAAITACQDQRVLEQLESWADKVKLYVVMPCIPRPGGGEWWDHLMGLMSGNDKVKFGRELGELLRPWIPTTIFDTIVSK